MSQRIRTPLLPPTVFAYIWQGSARHQFGLALAYAAVAFAEGGVKLCLNIYRGWYALQGRIEVGTVVAFVSGLAKVNDPWGDVVNWFREMTAVRMRYRLVANAVVWLAQEEGG